MNVDQVEYEFLISRVHICCFVWMCTHCVFDLMSILDKKDWVPFLECGVLINTKP